MDFEREHNRPVIILVGKRKYIRTEMNPKYIKIFNIKLNKYSLHKIGYETRANKKVLQYFSKEQKYRSQ